MNPSFYYVVTWREATAIHRQLIEIGASYRIQPQEDGSLAFVFPDMPVRLYGQIREIFGEDGRENDANGRRFRLVSDWEAKWIRVENVVSVTK
ncbi:hypothetical protein V5G20_17665 [Brevibacillus borstelensis]|uniref:hypothetical protein n=1 Tax=Brevibacillus borstelensis TaxID=45462 RepID=UPI0030CC59E5